jgi:hypothetical protein
VAKDATSSLSAMGQTAAIAPDTGALRRSAGLGTPDSGGPAYVTAEIPAVHAVGPSYGVLLPDGSVWYPGSRKRLPAPLLLRIVVWVLAFATLLAGAGDFVVRYHPSWLSAIRRTVPTKSAAANGGRNISSTSTPGTSSPASSGTVPAGPAVTKISPQPTLPPQTTAYSVVAKSYSVHVTAGSGPVFVFAESVKHGIPVTTGRVFESETVPAGGSYVITPTSGTVDVEVAASGATVALYFGPKLLGTITGRPSPWHYWFVGKRPH